MVLVALSKNQLIIDVRVYSWALRSIPLVCLSGLISVTHCFYSCDFVVSFEIEKCEFVLSQVCFGYSGSLEIQYEFVQKMSSGF